MPTPSSPVRISASFLGKTILALLVVTFVLLLSAVGSGWYALFPVCIPIAVALALFIIAIIKQEKMPNLNMLAWLTLGGACYFLARGWLSDSVYGKYDDMALVFIGMIFYVLGIFMGISQKNDRSLFAIAAFISIAGAVILLFQGLLQSPFTLFEPSQTLSLERIEHTGFFRYKNFSAHLMAGCGIFCCAYFIRKGISAYRWLAIGIVALAASLWCSSRSIYPNICLGALVCGVIYLCKIYHQTTKFIVSSIIGVIAILFAVFGAYIFLSQHQSLLQSVSSLWTSGGRFQMSSIAIDQACNAPWFGHGSLSFENLAIPYFHGFHASPNLAHNEYAQAMCDYGFTGFGILALLLIAHLVKGFSAVAKSHEESTASTARIGAAVALLFVASFHASMEFIWHNEAIVAAEAFCAGIICAGRPNRQKLGKPLNNWSLCAIAAAGIAFFSLLGFRSYPVWQDEWAFGRLDEYDSNGREEIIKDAIKSSYDPAITNTYASRMMSIYIQRNAILAYDLDFTMNALERALENSPNNQISKFYLGYFLNAKGEFEEADALLEPFTRANVYDDLMFAWRPVYILHLIRWGEEIAPKDPAKALSIIKEALKRHQSLDYYGKISRAQYRDIEYRLLAEEMLLEAQGVKPDDSWKKNHPPAK